MSMGFLIVSAIVVRWDEHRPLNATCFYSLIAKCVHVWKEF